MRYFLLLTTILFLSCSSSRNTLTIDDNGAAPLTVSSYADLSVELITRVKNGQNVDAILETLAKVSVDDLRNDLDTETEKKAFWLNVYNAYIQIILTEDPDLFENRKKLVGYNFFSSNQMTIAGKSVSFDKIEHGIIRRSKNKYSGGFVGKLFPGKFERKLRWAKVDPRVHFALNCGAKSCPFIAIYTPDRVEEQLDITTRDYLAKTTEYDAENDKVKVTSLMSWFRADFGGKKGGVKLLKKYNVIPDEASPSVSFLTYDWTLELGNYQDI